MFAADELEEFTAALRNSVDGHLNGHQWFVATTHDNDVAVAAAAYLAPEPYADRLWNLYFIAVHPSQHGKGIETALVEYLENLLSDAGEALARVMIVETSSTEQYGATRAFYLARGFVWEPQILDFYGPGDHKVVFWKGLTKRRRPPSPAGEPG